MKNPIRLTSRAMSSMGIALALTGAGVTSWGALAVTHVSADVTTSSVVGPECSTTGTTGCLRETFEGATATSFGSTCDFETQGTTTDGFHFVYPASEPGSFSSLTAYFNVNGTLVTETATITKGGMQAVVNAPNGAILLEAIAVISGGPTGSGTDDGTPYFVLSSTCAGTGGTSTTTSGSSTTTTTVPTTVTSGTTTTETDTTTVPTTVTETSGTTTTETDTTTVPTTVTETSGTTTTQVLGTTTTVTNTSSGTVTVVTTQNNSGGVLGLSTTSSSASSSNTGGVLGIITSTPNTGADTPYVAGLVLMGAGGLCLELSRRMRRRSGR